MSDYAVVNPATGETVKTYPTIGDDELDAAIGRADAAHASWARSSTVRSAPDPSGASASSTASSASGSARSSSARWASRSSRPWARSTSASTIYAFYADNAE